jgi:AbiV family abortive infection protein
MTVKKSVQKLYFKAAKESLLNARSWLEDANPLLYDKQSYGHSLSLVLFSIEETMKSWGCFTVGVGNQDPTDELVMQMFSSHPRKMEIAIMWYLVFNNPLFQATLMRELSDTEAEALKSFVESLESQYESRISRLVNLRMKGIYVDVLNGKKISTPNDITKTEAEGFYYDAFRFIQWMEQLMKIYEEATPQEKKQQIAQMKTSTRLWQENIEKISSLQNAKNEASDETST